MKRKLKQTEKEKKLFKKEMNSAKPDSLIHLKPWTQNKSKAFLS